MNTTDIILIAVILIPGLWVGIKKGFLFQLLTLVTLYISALLVSTAATPIAKWFVKSFGMNETIAKVTACILLFIVIYLLLYLLCTLILKMVRMVGGGALDKVLGIVFGIFKYMLIIGLLAMLFDPMNGKMDLIPAEKLDESFVYCAARDTAQTIFPYIKEMFKTISF